MTPHNGVRHSDREDGEHAPSKSAELDDTVMPPFLAPHLLVRGVLGQGGTAVVYDALHTRLQTRVAVKVLALTGPSAEEARARLRQEAQLCARLDDPHFPRIYDVDALPDGTPYVVLEYIEGRPLSELVACQPSSIEMAYAVGRELLLALSVLHAAGVVHRDIKPGNVMVQYGTGGRPRVRLVDFGIAKIVSAAKVSSELTHQGELVGTPHYMAPEQLTGRSLTARVDLYAVGVLLYEMLAARVPFDGPTISEVIASVLRDTPKPISAFRQDCPPALEAFVRRAMSRAPEQRFVSAEDMLQQLDLACAKAGSRLRLRVTELAAAPDLAGPPVNPVSRSKKRLSAALLALGGLVSVVGWAAWPLRPERRESAHAKPTAVPTPPSAPAPSVDAAETPPEGTESSSSASSAQAEALEPPSQAALATPTTSSEYALQLDLLGLRLAETEAADDGARELADDEQVPALAKPASPRKTVREPAARGMKTAKRDATGERGRPLAPYLEQMEALRDFTLYDLPPEEGAQPVQTASSVTTAQSSRSAIPTQGAPSARAPAPAGSTGEVSELPENPYRVRLDDVTPPQPPRPESGPQRSSTAAVSSLPANPYDSSLSP